MNDFTFLSPTRLIVGHKAWERTGEWIKAYGGHKVLVHHDSGYCKTSGLVDRIIDNIRAAGVETVELGGVVPNPHLSLVYKGIELCRSEGVDFLLAIGGGSVIDSTKAIGMGLKYDGDVWDLFASNESGCANAVETQPCMPVGVVLTMAATGSEASNSCVITKVDEQLKRFCDNDLHRPVFAIEDPELTMSLPKFQTSCGVIDIMSHSMERYFSCEAGGNELTDRLCEAIFHTCMDCGRRLMADPTDYDARASIMVASTISHNGLTGMGRANNGDWSSHFIEHELSGEYNVTHGAGLAVITPAWMKYVYKENMTIFLKYHSTGHELLGKRLGIVGFGRIGRRIGQLARAFGMQLFAYDPYLTAEQCAAFGAVKLEKEEFFRTADIFTIQLPLTEETRGLVAAGEIALMHNGAIVINMSRGGVLDEQAAAEGLRTGKLGGVGLDVICDELGEITGDGRVTSPVFDAGGNIAVSPHIGAATVEAQERVGETICTSLREALGL